MALSPQKFREIVFQLLYSLGFEKSERGELSLVMRQNEVPKTAARLAFEKAETIWQIHDELDQVISEKSEGYELERIPMIERTVLRLGIYELLHTDLPPKVVIAEAIRITRKYATAEGTSFINALLDRIYKEKEHAGSVSEEQTAQ
ncbi:MAG: transcription antitermination factor NusB [Verrucomicrobia bacterium]|nr:transcription antitermination factor NusB [Verrucomicrobiota bacterium]